MTHEPVLTAFSSLQRILMRSSIDQEVSEGYFTMRTEPMEQNKAEVSHMIAFEDQSDAINFSYLLESVFEDLEDFSANVVPISTKVKGSSFSDQQQSSLLKMSISVKLI